MTATVILPLGAAAWREGRIGLGAMVVDPIPGVRRATEGDQEVVAEALALTEDGSGAAVWAKPGRLRVPFTHTLRAFPQMRRVFGPRLGLATWSLLRIERLQPASPRA